MFDNFQSDILFLLITGSFVVWLILAGTAKIIQNKKLNEMVALLNEKNFDEFDRLIDSRLVKLVFDPFNVDYIKLNGCIYKQDKKAIDNAFLRFDQVKLTALQRDDIDLKAFNYYLSEGNVAKVHKYYKNIKDSSSNKMKKEVHRLYDIYIEKGSKYLDELIEETAALDERYKSSNELLISAIYGNLKNTEKEREYRELAERHLSGNL